MAAWLRNCRYMAAWADEVGEAGLSRRITDKPIYLFRKEDGGIAALLDRCPHRFAPLSRGTRDGDNVVCGYHGLTFSPEGKCVRNPFAERIPAGTDVPTSQAQSGRTCPASLGTAPAGPRRADTMQARPSSGDERSAAVPPK